MHLRTIAAVSTVALTLGVAACNSQAPVEVRDSTAINEAARDTDRAAEMQRDRERDLSKMDDRIAAIERDYDAKVATLPRGTSGAPTAGLRDEVRADVDDVKSAVANLRTTTADNWWERHQSALHKAFDDVERDVKGLSGVKDLRAKDKDKLNVADKAGQPVSAAPFLSSRDKFVVEMRARIDEMDKTLDNVKATGPRKTELSDLRARLDKLGEDVDQLKTAAAEDWWTVSQTRVNDYIERVEKSITRLDDNVR